MHAGAQFGAVFSEDPSREIGDNNGDGRDQE